MNLIKYGATLIAGVFIGGAITYKILKDKSEEMIDEEVEAMRAYYEAKYNPPKEEETEEKQEAGDNVVKLNHRKVIGDKKKINYNQYSKHLGSLTRDDGGEDEDTEDGEEDPNDITTRDEPYIISKEEFEETADHFDKITLTYYSVDDVLAENDEPINDIMSMVGDALTSFGVKSGDKDVVYIRNENVATDFEVCRLNDSYSKVVLGILPEKKTRTKAPKKVVNEDE